MKLKKYYEGYIKYLVQKGLNQKTIVEHRRFLYGALSHSVQDIKLKKLVLADVASVAEAGRVHGKYGAQRAVVTFRVFLRYLKEAGHGPLFDWRDVKVPKVPRIPVETLDQGELDLIRTHCSDDLQGTRERALIELILSTGLRIAEAISVNLDDVDWEKKEVHIENCKSHEREIVYLNDKAIYWLQAYINKRKDGLPYLFVSGRGRMLSTTARNYMRVHLGHLGIRKHIRHHIFRRTFATTLISRGCPINSTRILCRHKSSRTTLDYYVGYEKSQVKAIHQQILN